MRTYVIAISALVLTSACEQARETGWRLQNSAKGSIIKASDTMRDWVEYKPQAFDPRLPQQRYCYDAYSDVICYEQPQPHLTNKLIGYQGNDPYAASMVAPSAPMGVTGVSALPSQDTMIQISDNDQPGEPQELVVQY